MEPGAPAVESDLIEVFFPTRGSRDWFMHMADLMGYQWQRVPGTQRGIAVWNPGVPAAEFAGMVELLAGAALMEPQEEWTE